MIDAIGQDTTAAAAAMKKSTGMNKDDFLKLFITQLQNQDPLNPQDSSQFILQLAQLTQVEQSYNTNTNLQSLLTAAQNAAGMSSVSFIGKEVVAKGSQVQLTSGQQANLGYSLPNSAAAVTVDITDATGMVVRTLKSGKSPAGEFSLAWDGKDNQLRSLPTGIYSFSVTGSQADGTTFTATPLISGKVDGVELNGTQAMLNIGGISAAVDSLVRVKEVN